MGFTSALRDNTFIWFLRVSQCAVALTVLAVSIVNITDWHGIGCKIPEQLQVNVAAACVSLPFILYLMLSTGQGRIALLPWSAVSQAVVDATLLITWLMPSSFPSYDCPTICVNCNTSVNGSQNPVTSKAASGFYVWVGKLTCSCYMANIDDGGHFRRVAATLRRNAYLRPGKADRNTKIFKGVARIAAKRSLDWVMMYADASHCPSPPVLTLSKRFAGDLFNVDGGRSLPQKLKLESIQQYRQSSRCQSSS